MSSVIENSYNFKVYLVRNNMVRFNLIKMDGDGRSVLTIWASRISNAVSRYESIQLNSIYSTVLTHKTSN